MSDFVQDTIKFTLVAEDTVVNNTVRLNATISCIVTPDMTEAKLKDSIREMMKSFISETIIENERKAVVWNFSNMNRTSHPSGLEQIDLVASTRIHESNNYSLDKRSAAVSKEGMSITNITVETNPPLHMIEEAESNLRLKLLAKSTRELDKINKAMDLNTYRLATVEFLDASSGMMISNARKTAVASSYGSGFGDEDNSLGNAVKLTMKANVTLARIKNIKS